jgi:hypothetical protein
MDGLHNTSHDLDSLIGMMMLDVFGAGALGIIAFRFASSSFAAANLRFELESEGPRIGQVYRGGSGLAEPAELLAHVGALPFELENALLHVVHVSSQCMMVSKGS